MKRLSAALVVLTLACGPMPQDFPGCDAGEPIKPPPVVEPERKCKPLPGASPWNQCTDGDLGRLACFDRGGPLASCKQVMVFGQPGCAWVEIGGACP